MVSDWVEAVHLRVEHDFGFELLDLLFYVCHFPHNENSLTQPQKIATLKSHFFNFFSGEIGTVIVKWRKYKRT